MLGRCNHAIGLQRGVAAELLSYRAARARRIALGRAMTRYVALGCAGFTEWINVAKGLFGYGRANAYNEICGAGL